MEKENLKMSSAKEVLVKEKPNPNELERTIADEERALESAQSDLADLAAKWRAAVLKDDGTAANALKAKITGKLDEIEGIEIRLSELRERRRICT
jgi:hypothetical protein